LIFKNLQETLAVSTPISCFENYFTAELFEDFSKITNIYALRSNQEINSLIYLKKRENEWLAKLIENLPSLYDDFNK
jgi:hypothetical protein